MSAILIDANGARLATGGYDYDVKLWDFKFKFVNSNIYDYKNEVSKHTRVLLDIWLNTIVCQIKTRIILYISNLGSFIKIFSTSESNESFLASTFCCDLKCAKSSLDLNANLNKYSIDLIVLKLFSNSTSRLSKNRQVFLIKKRDD